MLSREDILEADDLKTVIVDLRPDWPGAVFVRSMTGEERGEFDLQFTGDDEGRHIKMREHMAVG